MKSRRFLVLVVMAFLIILVASNCTLHPGSKGQITLIIANKINAKTLAPAISMEVDNYVISGIGPESSTFSGSTTNSSFTANGLQIGNWEITVDAYNSNGIKIGSGTNPVQITVDPSIVTVEVIPVVGKGGLELTVIWPENVLSEPGISATFGKVGHTPSDIDFLIAGNRATHVNDELDNGYYTFAVSVLDEGIAVGGAADVIRIVAGQTTSGQFEFQDFNEIGGALTVSAVNNLYPPLDVQFTTFELNQPAGTVQTLSASVTNCDAQVAIDWFVNGKYKSTGSEYVFGQDLPPGPFRIDVVAYMQDGKRAGSSSISIQMVENPQYAQVQIDGNSMWNGFAYYSWQNRTHVYEADNTNAVIDTWKIDDNNNGDPKDDLNRILWNGQTDVANGIWFGIHSQLNAQSSGWEYSAIIDDSGNGVLAFTKTLGSSHATAKYTLKPDSGKLYGELNYHTDVGGSFTWGINIISGVWVSNGLGELSLYDKAYLNGNIITARPYPLYGDFELGVDYLKAADVTTGEAAIFSTERSWESVFRLTESSLPLDLHAYVVMASQYGGWGFNRCAILSKQLSAGDEITLNAVFDSEVSE